MLLCRSSDGRDVQSQVPGAADEASETNRVLWTVG